MQSSPWVRDVKKPPPLLTEAMLAHSEAGTATALTFLDYSGGRAGEPRSLSYADLVSRARTLAGELSQRCSPGDRVAIMCSQRSEYVVAFLSCMFAGVIAVPLYVPDPSRGNERLLGILRDARPAQVLVTADARDAVLALVTENVLLGLETPLLVDLEALASRAGMVGAGTGLPATARSEIAYLQYTSGSTRHPTGVRVTHLGLAEASRQASDRLRLTRTDTMVTWLPFFHDMGLVLTLLTPLICGMRTVFMSPQDFVHRPARWLRALSTYRGTVTATPNFGLELCLTAVTESERRDLDLSHLDAVANGAEPVRATTLRRFTETFAETGFRPEAHCPGYGLAEATLTVALTARGSGATTLSCDADALKRGEAVPVPVESAGAKALVSCGRPVDQEVCVVEPASRRAMPDSAVGELWVRGGNVCDGYWEARELTSAVFGSSIVGPDMPDDIAGWLRTGDLGFRRDGEIFVVGRLKDVIVRGGLKHEPSDIETSIEEVSSVIRRGRVAAFQVDDETEHRLVVVVEVREDDVEVADLARRVRSAVSARHGIAPDDVVLAAPGSVPTTTSGKVRRRDCRAQYTAGTLKRLG